MGEISTVAESQLGLAVLDEPAANQSDPALLNLQLRAASISVSHTNQMMVSLNISLSFKYLMKTITGC